MAAEKSVRADLPARRAPRVRIGISGWRYPPWRGTFYPTALPQDRELAFASRQVATIEINGTFYSLARPESFARWAGAVPAGFVFSVKGGRYITHVRRLREVREALANFFASGVLQLGSRLGPFLWQLPPSLRFQPEVLDSFLRLLPRDTKAALALAREHTGKVAQAWLGPTPQRRLRHALEVRHASFATPEFVALLRRHRVALVIADTAGKWPFLEDLTADFVYARLHGDAELYVSGYTPTALREWARKIRAWSRGRNPRGARTTAPLPRPRNGGREVFVYFDNDVKVRAPHDAQMLAHLLGLGPKPKRTPRPVIAEVPRMRWPGYGSKRGRG